MPDLIMFAAVLAVSGALAGLIAGLLGVGGGIVIVPVLFYLLPTAGVPLELRMHVAVATSLATIIATSIVSARAHHKKGGVDVPLLKSLVIPIAVGVVIGVALGGRASGATLTLVFAIVALIVSVHMALFQNRKFSKTGLPGAPWRQGIGVFIGAFSVVMGIGGGTLSVPIFTLFGLEIRRAVGTAAAIGLIIAVPGTIGFAISGWGVPDLPPLSVGYVNLIGFILIVPLSMALAPLGAKLAHNIPREWLARAFALFLLVTSLRMIASV
ncbi:MAG: sulfite exporter TauE/SafE family protein [Pseudomonadota bacterium]